MNSDVIIGIVIGIVTVIILVILAIVFVRRFMTTKRMYVYFSFCILYNA